MKKIFKKKYNLASILKDYIEPNLLVVELGTVEKFYGEMNDKQLKKIMHSCEYKAYGYGVKNIQRKIELNLLDGLEDIQNLSFEDESLDIIIINNVLEHVKNPQLAIDQCFRCLKHNGYLFSATPFINGYHGRNSSDPCDSYEDYWRFTAAGLKFLVRRFRSTIINPRNGRISTLVSITPFGRYKLIRAIISFIEDNFLYKSNATITEVYYMIARK